MAYLSYVKQRILRNLFYCNLGKTYEDIVRGLLSIFDSDYDATYTYLIPLWKLLLQQTLGRRTYVRRKIDLDSLNIILCYVIFVTLQGVN